MGKVAIGPDRDGLQLAATTTAAGARIDAQNVTTANSVRSPSLRRRR
jgi:hypothetical protein